jgi:hypothetical protein
MRMAEQSGSSSDGALDSVVERIAAKEPAAAGPAIACCLALAAGLAELTAIVAGAADLAADAHSLRRVPVGLARADAEAYAAYLRSGAAADRERTIELPLKMAKLAARTAEVAARAAGLVSTPARGDAAVGALLAEAAARAATLLIQINTSTPGDQRLAEAARFAKRAAVAASLVEPEPGEIRAAE